MIDASNIPVYGLCVAGIVWAVRLEGQVGARTQLFVEREKRAERLEAHLMRIENKLDNVLERKR